MFSREHEDSRENVMKIKNGAWRTLSNTNIIVVIRFKNVCSNKDHLNGFVYRLTYEYITFITGSVMHFLKNIIKNKKSIRPFFEYYFSVFCVRIIIFR